MADDAGEVVASAVISIAADLNPLKLAMSTLPAMLAAPLTQTAGDVKNFIGDLLDNSLTGALRGNIGTAIANLGQGAVHGVAGTLRSAMTTIFGEVLGGGLATLTVSPIAKIVSGLFGGAGAAIKAATGPLRRALGANLLDLDQWVEKSIEAESAQIRFAAVLHASGEVAGWSGGQLKIMADQLSSAAGASTYGAGEIRKAQTALLAFQNVRGDRFASTLAAGMDLAAAKGMDLSSAVQVLGMALQQPEQGFHHLRRSAGIFFSEQEAAALKSAGTVEAQQDLILAKVRQSFSGVAATMAGTTEGLLAQMRNSWGGIGRSIGDVLLPVTHTLAELGAPLISWLAGTVKPVFAEAKAIVADAMAGVKGFFDRNIETFREWGQIGKEIFSNVWNLAKEAFKSLFGGFDAGGKAQSMFDGIKGGVTTVLKSIRDIAASWGNVKLAAVVAWDYVSGKALDVWSQFRDAAVEAWSWVKDEATTIYEWLEAQAPSVWEAFRDQAQDSWDYVMDTAQATWQFIKDLPETMWQAMLNFAPDAFDAIKGFASGAWDAIQADGEAKWQAIGETIQGVFDDVWALARGDASAFWARFEGMGRQAIGALVGPLDMLFGNAPGGGGGGGGEEGGGGEAGATPKSAADQRADERAQRAADREAARQAAQDARDQKRVDDVADREEQRAAEKADREEQRARDLEALKAAMADARQKAEAARAEQLKKDVLGKPNEEAVGAGKSAMKSVGFAEMFKDIQSHVGGSYRDPALEEAKKQRAAAEKAANLLDKINEKMQPGRQPQGLGFGV